MAMVRERRHQPALRLPLPLLPESVPVPELRYPLPLLLPPFGPGSPTIETFSDLEKLDVLGHGSGGIVYKVRHRLSSAFFALKVLRFDGSNTAREAEILKKVDSPFVVRCHGVFDRVWGELCFVMEHMDVGSLLDVLRFGRRLPEAVIAGVARRVLEGLSYLHGMGIVHRDVKPSNLLINGRGEVKIADFGVSKVVAGAPQDPSCDSCVSTCAYMSPERFGPDGCDGFAGDVWSLGVTMLECYVGHFPLIPAGQKPDWVTLVYAICFEEPPEVEETASSEFRSFIRRCLEKDWRRRATVAELLTHPFVVDGCPSSSSLI